MVKVIIATITFALNCSAASWYVSPTGSGSGTIGSPGGLATALAGTGWAASIAAGDTVFMRGGTYTASPWTSSLVGTAGNPIIVRNYPGEVPILEDSASSSDNCLSIYGHDVRFQGFQIQNSTTGRVAGRGNGIAIRQSTNISCVNLIIHDCGNGIGMWPEAVGGLVYGCICYNNGYQDVAPDRGHGHGIYVQNTNDPITLLSDNVTFNQYSYGMQGYGATVVPRNITMLRGISFNNGIISDDLRRTPNYFFGGLSPVDGITEAYCLGFQPYGSASSSSIFGYDTGDANFNNGSFVCFSNYFAGGDFLAREWTNMTVLNNQFALGSGIVIDFPGTHEATVSWNGNQYWMTDGTPFNAGGTSKTFAQWKTWKGYDASGSLSGTMPAGAVSFVYNNAYEAGRSHIVVYNWGTMDNVSVDLSTAMAAGATYSLYSLQNPLAAAVKSGTYAGGAISLPMTNLVAATPVGHVSPPSPVSPAFGPFLLLSTNSVTPPLPISTAGQLRVGRLLGIKP